MEQKNDEKVRVNASFTKEQVAKIDEFRQVNGLSRSAVVALAVSEWLAERERNNR